MSKVTSSEIGEILYRLYESEIEFRLENMFDDGYRWSIIGYVGERTQDINLRRMEIDDLIMDQDQHNERFQVCTDEMRIEQSIPHFLNKDWLARGAESQLVMSITKLAEAAVTCYPDSDFAKWFAIKEEKQEGEKYLYSLHSAEDLILQLPADNQERNRWLRYNGISDEAERLREVEKEETVAAWKKYKEGNSLN
jgi:hypothetical protein